MQIPKHHLIPDTDVFLPNDYINTAGLEGFEFSKVWLVEGLVEDGKAYQFFGKWKGGKTLAIMDMCASAACGLPWGNRRTEKMFVIWVASESRDFGHELCYQAKARAS